MEKEPWLDSRNSWTVMAKRVLVFQRRKRKRWMRKKKVKKRMFQLTRSCNQDTKFLVQVVQILHFCPTIGFIDRGNYFEKCDKFCSKTKCANFTRTVL